MNINKARELLQSIAKNVPRWDRELDEIQREFTAEAERRALRDQFAMAALQGLLANNSTLALSAKDYTLLTERAWECADAMIAAREKVG